MVGTAIFASIAYHPNILTCTVHVHECVEW